MERPWTWVLTDKGWAHATAADVAPDVEISAVCGVMVIGSPQSVVFSHVNPCLSCLQLVGAPSERVGAR